MPSLSQEACEASYKLTSQVEQEVYIISVILPVIRKIIDNSHAAREAIKSRSTFVTHTCVDEDSFLLYQFLENCPVLSGRCFWLKTVALLTQTCGNHARLSLMRSPRRTVSSSMLLLRIKFTRRKRSVHTFPFCLLSTMSFDD